MKVNCRSYIVSQSQIRSKLRSLSRSPCCLFTVLCTYPFSFVHKSIMVMLFFRPPPHLTSSVHFNLNSAQSRSVVVLYTRISCAVACSLLFIFVETCLNTFSFSLSLLLRRPSLSLFVHRTCLNCLTSPYRRRGKRKKKKPNRFTKQKRTMSVNIILRVSKL